MARSSHYYLQEVIQIISKNVESPDRGVDQIRELINTSDVLVRQYVAWYHKTPHEILLLLADDEDQTVRWGVSRNPSVSADILRKLLVKNKADKSIIHMILSSNVLPQAEINELTQQLTKSRSASMRETVAAAPRTPLSVRKLLANDSTVMVREAIAISTYTPKVLLLWMLMRKQSVGVTQLLISRVDSPTFRHPLLSKIMVKLSQDKRVTVRERVRDCSHTPENIKAWLTLSLPK